MEYYNKLITRIELYNGTIVMDQIQILAEIFYQNLYSAPCEQKGDGITAKLSNLHFRKQIDDEAQSLEGEITYSEVLIFLKSMHLPLSLFWS